MRNSAEETDCAAEVTETQIRVFSENAWANSVSLSADGLPDAVNAEATEAVETAPRRRGDVARQRLDQIFKGAFKVISKKGYGSATIREIAAAAKIPIPTMYLYVKTKEDLLYLMTKEYLSKLVKDFEELLSESSTSTAVLEKAVVQYIAYCNSQRRLINLVYREGKWLTPQNCAKIFKLDLSFVAIWKRIVEHGIETGEFQVKDPSSPPTTSISSARPGPCVTGTCPASGGSRSREHTRVHHACGQRRLGAPPTARTGCRS